jgi:hypothetical protein
MDKQSRIQSQNSLVVIDDLDKVGVAVPPDKAYAPLIIDPDRVLAAPIAPQSLQTIGRWRSQIEQSVCAIHHQQLAPRNLLKAPPPAVAAIASEQGLSPATPEALDHCAPTYTI